MHAFDTYPMTPDTETFTVAPGDQGPDGTAQGGMLAGNLAVLADRVDGPFEVTLHSAGPLGVPLQLRTVDEERTGIWREDRLIADVRPVTAAPTAPAPVDLSTARRVAGGLALTNPFPRCVVCGPQRPDGLGVRPGALHDGPRVAAVLPRRDGPASVAAAVGALDCTSGYALLAQKPEGLAVTGRLRVQLHRSLPTGQDAVVVGEAVGSEGRVHRTRSAIYTAGGELCAAAHVTWVDVRFVDL